MTRSLRITRIYGGNILKFESADDGWTLSKCHLSDPELLTNYLNVPGRPNGALDFSTALTDGEPVYNNRTFEATVELSAGTRIERAAKIRALYNNFEGQVCKIYHPDYLNWTDHDSLYYAPYFLTGRVHIRKEKNDLAHAIVHISATVEPWLYSASSRPVSISVGSTESIYTYTNNGAMPLRPSTVQITGNVTITGIDGSWSYTLTDGTYILPEVVCYNGKNQIFKHKGSGRITLNFDSAEGLLE